MADDQFQLNWWDSSRNRFENKASTGQATSQASSINNTASAMGAAANYGGWSSPSDSLTVSSMGHEHLRPSMGLGLSSTNHNLDWSSNQGLLGEKSESSFRQLIQDDRLSPFEAGGPSSSGASSSHEQNHWRIQRPPAALHSSSSCDQDHYSQINQGFSLDHHHQASSNDHFQQVDSAAGYGLLLSENHHQQQQQHTSPYDHQYGNQSASNDPLMASWNKYQNFLRTSPPRPPKQQLHFTNNTPFWNATAVVDNDPRPSFFSTQNIIPVAPLYEEKPKAASDVATTKKSSTAETSSNKRPRNESSSSLPAFKVRKEKMGDRITALQQLVSPFGKTDTASVLSEAIQYIKFLHEQVSVLSTPYMKNGNPQQHHQISDKSKDQEGPRQDLRSRGLCLVPVSSTFPMTHETTVDFWTPTFGGTFRC